MKLAERLAAGLDDPRAPERTRPSLAEMIRVRLLAIVRAAAPADSGWRAAQFDTLRPGLIQGAARVTETLTRITVALPTACPHASLSAPRELAAYARKLPPSAQGAKTRCE